MPHINCPKRKRERAKENERDNQFAMYRVRANKRYCGWADGTIKYFIHPIIKAKNLIVTESCEWTKQQQQTKRKIKIKCTPDR